MSGNWSLRKRLSITLAVFSGFVSLALASIIYIASHDLEARIIDDTLTAELDDYIARRERNPLSLPEQTATIRAYVITSRPGNTNVPEVVSRLPPGRHDIQLDGVSYHAGVRSSGEQRYVVLYNTSALQQREKGFVALLITSVALVSLASALAGRLLASRIIAPVNTLASRVSQLTPEQQPTSLAEEFPWIEVRSLAESFDAHLLRINEFIERERLFTGDVSHELRTPLAVISGASELMLNDDTLDTRSQKRLLRIARAVTEMEEITAALLSLAREKGDASSHSTECELETVTRELVDRYRELFQHKDVELVLQVRKLSGLRVDHAIFSMVLGNLLRNALSYTEQGQVTVTIDGHTVLVADNGPGLGDNRPETLFKPYVRGDHAYSGAGLGLSLIKRLCKLAGWSIQLQNRQGGGALAILSLT